MVNTVDASEILLSPLEGVAVLCHDLRRDPKIARGSIPTTPPTWRLEVFWKSLNPNELHLPPHPGFQWHFWRFRLGFPILKMVHNPGGDWNPGWGVDLTNEPQKKNKTARYGNPWNTSCYNDGILFLVMVYEIIPTDIPGSRISTPTNPTQGPFFRPQKNEDYLNRTWEKPTIRKIRVSATTPWDLSTVNHSPSWMPVGIPRSHMSTWKICNIPIWSKRSTKFQKNAQISKVQTS